MPLFQNGKRNLTERRKTGFFAVQIAFKMQKLVSPETGDEFESDDVSRWFHGVIHALFPVAVQCISRVQQSLVASNSF